MLPEERQKKIKDLIITKHNIKISELSERLGVSEMTIHRDIKPLVDEGIVMKTFGGITLVQEQRRVSPEKNECVYCFKNVDQRLNYRLILSNHKVESACCAHCGLLRHQQLEHEAVQAICQDFLTLTTVSAFLSWYVMDCEVDIGCCQPQVLTFSKKEYAERFVQGFGGRILSFEEAKEKVYQEMKGRECCSTGEQHDKI